MRERLSLIVLLAAAVAAILSGCSDNNSTITTPAPSTDALALKSIVVSADSVAAFSSSDELTMDDNGAQDPDFDIVTATDLGKVSFTTHIADSTYPVRWGRKIYWDSISRHYDVTTIGDTVANVLITKTVPGEFRVAWGTRTPDTVIIDTVVRKPFTETVQRKVVFRRIARTDNPYHNWVPVALTMVKGTAGNSPMFHIASVEVSASLSGLDTTITDPLNQWFRLGFFHGSIPVFPVGDSIRVKVTVNSSDAKAELAFLRHGVARGWLDRRRAKMTLESESGGAGAWTRVYTRTIRTGMDRGMLAARCNVVVDVLSNGTVYSKTDPFTNEFWGAPYILIR